MKKLLSILLVLVGVAIIGGAFLYLYKKSQTKPVVYTTEQAEISDITKKTVATGSIVPRREVEVKPKVNGVISELYVEAGKTVTMGQPLGKISIIPDAGIINTAESQVRMAQISLDNAKREIDRNEALFKQGIVADAELQKFRTDYALRQQELNVANSTLQLAREGATRGQGKLSTLVITATAPGEVIDVPVKEGFSVIQANNFNAGTTVAVIADMDDMIFDGRVDEAEVAKIKEGMKLSIKVGAIEKERLDGTLEFIAPKGKEIDGAIQF
ncbi:MAG TPA: efflux RND transporter periplasmic adaptor subunit, partial [Kofleriaceae bacterium]|nr:efflux RND transporter periplasmic adaptor subunit [Kofleriaceae bacterium]